MKYLKTFLFTITLTFLSFGVVTLSGFCEAAPTLTPDSSSLSVIQGGGMPYYYGMQGYGEMYFMTPEFNQSINDMGSAVDTWLENNTGYSSDDYIMKSALSLPSVPQLNNANWIANRLTNGLGDASQTLQNGYSLVRQKVTQWGSDSYQYFMGKVDDINNTLSDVCDNFVLRISQQGIDNYLNLTQSLTNDNDLINSSDFNFLFGKSFSFHDSINNYYYNLNFNNNVVLVNVSGPNNYNYVYVYPSGSYDLSGYIIDTSSGNRYTIKSLFIGYSQYVDVNGTSFLLDRLAFLTDNGPTISQLNLPLAYFESYINNLGLNVNPIYNYYNYSPSVSESLNNLLNRLLDKWVDSRSMKEIQTIINNYPIVIENIDNKAVPVCEPSPQQLEDLEDKINTILQYHYYYDSVLSEESPSPEPEPDPEPEPINQGTAVPEDFPTTIFTPINDSVGSIFDFVSIFEPLFYIFSFSAGLLGLWIVVPFVILFLILFRLLK